VVGISCEGAVCMDSYAFVRRGRNLIDDAQRSADPGRRNPRRPRRWCSAVSGRRASKAAELLSQTAHEAMKSSADMVIAVARRIVSDRQIEFGLRRETASMDTPALQLSAYALFGMNGSG